MAWNTLERKSPADLLEREETALLARDLPSGRRVVIDLANGEEHIDLYSPRGEMEVRITLGESGPTVSLRGARLEMEAIEKLAIRCKELAIIADEGASLRTGGVLRFEGDEVRFKSIKDIHLNGTFIRLNCPPNVERVLDPPPHQGP
ncbi:MAG: hypothetical protein U1D30_21035 [Planctomycetota bacterium]